MSGGTRNPAPYGGDPGRRRRRLLAGWIAGAAIALAATASLAWRLADGSGEGSPERAAERAADARWAEGITTEWMSEQMGLEVPGTAGSARAAYRITSRFDTGLLTFTLTRPEADSYLQRHPAEGRWLTPTGAPNPGTPNDFAHLGLPEPERFKEGLRYGYVCPDTTEAGGAGAPDAESGPDASNPYDTSDPRCVRLYAHEYAPDRTRIYLRAHFDPGVSVPPVSPSSGAS